MENDRRDPLPEFDADYIDQLFSRNNPTKKKAPFQAAAPEKPKPSAPKEPEKAEVKADKADVAPKTHPVNRLVILTAVVCLLLGFSLGRLSLPNPEPSPGTSIPLQTNIEIDPIDPGFGSGIAEDYASMSTLQLVSIAVQISDLSYYGYTGITPLDPDTYNRLKRANPVLIELEQRPDAVEVLEAYLLTKPTTDPTYLSANALIYYYSTYLNNTPPVDVIPATDRAWILRSDEYVTIYEFTEAPVITREYFYGGTISGPCTTLDFDGTVYTLAGSIAERAEQANFWFCIQLNLANAHEILAAEPEPRLAVDRNITDGGWFEIQRYHNGWFVYGYASRAADIYFTFSPQPGTGTSLHYVELAAIPGLDSSSTQVLVQDLANHYEAINEVVQLNPHRDLSQYPPVAALLAREDGMSKLLDLAQTDANALMLLDLVAIAPDVDPIPE